MSLRSEFEVLESRPRILFTLTRDSVCTADDIEPHDRSVETFSILDPAALAQHLPSDYVQSVAGFGHTWDCFLNGKLIATLSPNGRAIAAGGVGEVEYEEHNAVHFKYNSAPY